MSAPSSRNRRAGTILLFFLSAMVVVSTFVTTMLRSQSDSASGVSADELRLVADAMALSGIELMATIAGNAAENGPQFLSDRERSLGVSTPYSMDRLFSFPTGVAGTYYVPPLEYPALKDLALSITPTNQPPYIQDTDILLLNASDSTKIPASSYYLVMGGTSPTGFAGPSILPNELFQPLQSDTTNYDGARGCSSTGGGQWRITALEPGASNVPVGWYGDKNGASYLPVTASRYTGYTGCQKMRPPSFVLGRTHQAAFGATYRTFLYAWYVRSNTFAAAPERQYYYMTSGRVREIRNASGTISLGPEVAVSNTQLR